MKKAGRRFHRIFRAVFAAALALAITGANLAPAAAVTWADVNELKDEANGLDAEKKELQAKLDALADDKSQAVARKELLDQQIANTEAQIANTQAQIDRYAALISDSKVLTEMIQKASAACGEKVWQMPADELFLQYPASDANTVYTIDGAAQTVRARLTRAVCRISVTVKRGYHDGTRYVEVPYAKPQSVLDQIGRIELSADHTGLRVNPGGSSGTATVTATLTAADYAELTDGGFVRLEGPFVIPPADGGEVGLDITVVPAAGAALQPVQLRLTGKAERNKQLDITLWITSDYPVIGVEIQTTPITEEQDGDTGIWE